MLIVAEELKWSKAEVKSKENPPILWGHSMNVIFMKIHEVTERPSEIVSFFLEGQQSLEATDATFGCSISVQIITNFTYNPKGQGIWTKPQQSGTPPTPRSYHASAVYGNRLLIFGGVASDNNLYVLNTGTIFLKEIQLLRYHGMESTRDFRSRFSFLLVKLISVGPDARKELTVIVPVKDKKMIVFGGVSQGNFETLNELHTMEFGREIQLFLLRVC